MDWAKEDQRIKPFVGVEDPGLSDEEKAAMLKRFDIINYRFLTTETNLKALYIYCCLFITSLVKLFVVNVQIFVYNCVFRNESTF